MSSLEDKNFTISDLVRQKMIEYPSTSSVSISRKKKKKRDMNNQLKICKLHIVPINQPCVSSCHLGGV